MKILDVYGMTETTGAVTANTPDAFRLGTVGRPLPGMEIKIAEDGEILVRGPVTTPGYLGQPEASAGLLGADGWLHTGDIGALDADQFLSVVDRKKELIITAGGENMSPTAIEGLLVEHPLIGQALAFGDRSPTWWRCSPSTARWRPPGRRRAASRRVRLPNWPPTPR